MCRSVLIVGSSGHARSVLDVVRCHYGSCKPAFLDDRKERYSRVYGVDVLGSTSDISDIYRVPAFLGVIVAIGDNWDRYTVAGRLVELCPEIEFITAVHPDASVSEDAVIGRGTVVMPGAVVGPGCRIGSHCVVNTASSIDHDCTLGDFCSVAPGVTLGGNVVLGEGCFVGLGGNVIHNTRIGRHTVIGAGATVLSDVGDNLVAYGTPAREIRQREPHEQYL
jgi:sugar O-acyltransferase (sialic acid O-acetyltransferase NeuD family)